MKIKWLGHASFLITSDTGVTVITDPYATGGNLSYGEIQETADIITVSHGHYDHNNTATVKGNPVLVNKAGSTEAKGINFKGTPTAHDDEGGKLRGNNLIFCFEMDGIKVTATNAFHGSSIALEDGTTIYGGEPLGFVVEFESGFKLYHAGDTSLFGDMQLIGELYGPDLALLPIGDRLTMGPLEAAHAARLLGVQHVVPMHYSTDVLPFFTGTPEKLQEHLSEIAPGVAVHTMQPGDDLTS